MAIQITLQTEQGAMLTLKESTMVTSTQVNYFEVVFEFDEEWDGYLRTAVFISYDEQIRRTVEMGSGNTCLLPTDPLKANEWLRIAVYGKKGDKVLATNYIDQWVVRGADIVPDPPVP